MFVNVCKYMTHFTLIAIAIHKKGTSQLGVSLTQCNFFLFALSVVSPLVSISSFCCLNFVSLDDI